MDNPIVSVIMPAYNAAPYIRQSIESIQKQSFSDWECLVSDDQSNDETAQIVEEISQTDPRIKLIRCSKKMFTALARNEALKIAKGRYIAFLDSDDLWLPNKLEVQISYMKNNDIDFCFHSYRYIDKNNTLLNQIVKAPKETTFHKLLKGNTIGCLTAVYDTNKLGHVPMHDGFHTREDYICWLDILKKTSSAKGLSEVLALYRIHPSASTASKTLSAKRQWKVYRNYLRLSFIESAFYLVNYALNGLKKHNVLKIN